MKKYLIAIAVVAIGVVAIADTKARIEELDEMAANTPSQVEMKKDLPKATGAGIQPKIEQVQTTNQLDNQKFKNMINTPSEFPRTLPPQTPEKQPNIPTVPQMP